MKHGSAETFLEKREEKKKIFDKLETFHSNLEVEKLMAKDEGEAFAIVEVPKELLNYFLSSRPKGDAEAFEQTGYMMYQGAAICEEGKKDSVIKNIDLTSSKQPHELVGIHV